MKLIQPILNVPAHEFQQERMVGATILCSGLVPTSKPLTKKTVCHKTSNSLCQWTHISSQCNQAVLHSKKFTTQSVSWVGQYSKKILLHSKKFTTQSVSWVGQYSKIFAIFKKLYNTISMLGGAGESDQSATVLIRLIKTHDSIYKLNSKNLWVDAHSNDIIRKVWYT